MYVKLGWGGWCDLSDLARTRSARKHWQAKRGFASPPSAIRSRILSKIISRWIRRCSASSTPLRPTSCGSSPCSHHRCRGRRPWHRIREQRILILGSGIADPGILGSPPQSPGSQILGPGSRIRTWNSVPGPGSGPQLLRSVPCLGSPDPGSGNRAQPSPGWPTFTPPPLPSPGLATNVYV